MSDPIPPGASIALFTLFFAVTFTYIYRKDVVFSFFYLLLFAYTIFTELAHWIAPDVLALQGVPLGSENDWWNYQLFVRGSFVVVFALFALLFHRGGKRLRPVRQRNGRRFVQLFYLIVSLYAVALLVLFLASQGSINYGEQTALKQARLFSKGFGFATAMVFVLVAVRQTSAVKWEQRLGVFLLTFLLLDIMLISAKAGSRGALGAMPIGWFVYSALKRRPDRQPLWFWIKTALVVLIVGYLAIALQVERRNPDTTLFSYLLSLSRPGLLFQDYLFSPIGLLFQDYTGPSVLLAYSIQSNMVAPWESLRSVLLGGVPFSGVPTLGWTAARGISDLEYSWQGFGYYFLNEGFAVMGWFGMVYNGVVLNLGYWVWRRFFIDVNDRNLRALMGALVAMMAIGVIRAQSSTFLYQTFYTIAPALVLYYLGTGTRPQYLLSWTEGRRRRSISADGYEEVVARPTEG